MGEDEQRAAIGCAEYDASRPLRYVDLTDQLAGRRVNEHLPVGDVNISSAIDRNAFSATLRERLEIAERPVGPDGPAVGAVLCVAHDVRTLSRERSDEAVSVECVRPAPARFVHSRIR